MVTVGGETIGVDDARSAVERLLVEEPFVTSARYGPDKAQVCYWDEGDDAEAVAGQALRIWGTHRRSAQLPDWKVIALEVLDRESAGGRWRGHPPVLVLGEVRPFTDHD